MTELAAPGTTGLGKRSTGCRVTGLRGASDSTTRTRPAVGPWKSRRSGRHPFCAGPANTQSRRAAVPPTSSGRADTESGSSSAGRSNRRFDTVPCSMRTR